MWQHIYPLDDAYEHNMDSLNECDCNPFIDWKHELVIHYAFDGRDLILDEGDEVVDLPNNTTIKIGHHAYGVHGERNTD